MTAGHNSGLLSPETIQAALMEDHSALVQRTEDLKAAFARMPAKVEDDATAGRVADFAKQFRDHCAALKKAHEGTKEPYLVGGRLVDQFFNPAIKELTALKDQVLSRNTVYFTAKETAERRAREEAERIAREEAERKAKEAQTDADLDAAIQAEAAAAEAAKATQATTAEITRVHSAHGTATSLRSYGYKHRNVDRAKLDLETLRPYLPAEAIDQAIRAYLKAQGTPPDALKGVEFYEDKRAA